MTTGLLAAINQMSSDVEAIVPPDRTAVRYHEVDGRIFLAGTAGDRAFTFGLPTRNATVTDGGPAYSHVEWTVPMLVRFKGRGRSAQTRLDAAANEVNLICRTIDKRAAWPTGTIQIETREASPEETDESSEAVYRIEIVALIEETD